MVEKLRIALVDEKPERSGELERSLAEVGHEVVARLSSCQDLRERTRALAPDVIIVDMQSPDRDVFEDMQRIHREEPRPIVMFVDESNSEQIQEAVRVGVSAYVVDGLKPGRVQPIIEAAIARFRSFQALRNELEAARSSLAERKEVERAKGILMRRRGLSEEQAYTLLRKAAMNSKLRLAEVARRLIEMAEIL